MPNNADTWSPSRRLQSAAEAERGRLQRTLDQVNQRYAQLSVELAATEDRRDALREQLAMLDRLVHGAGDEANDDGRSPHADAPAAEQANRPKTGNGADTHGQLVRGRAVRETAVRVLASSPQATHPVHYRAWYEMVRAEGFLPAGKDSVATFLTQLGRSPVVARTSRQGVYVLDFEFPARARHRLEKLRAQLQESHAGPVGVDPHDLAAVRKRRGTLLAEVERLERELEEALRSLATASSPLRASA